MSDPEIEAMSHLAADLQKLDDDARARVLHWAAARYGIPIEPAATAPAPGSPDGVLGSDGTG